MPAGGARRDLLAQELNSRDRDQFLETDARLVEFIKFLMFSQAADLYRRQGAGEDVPLWFLLFSLRDNSASLAEFFHYHLNLVGDSLGLEQVGNCCCCCFIVCLFVCLFVYRSRCSYWAAL